MRDSRSEPSAHTHRQGRVALLDEAFPDSAPLPGVVNRSTGS
jgi:hypothetical protein